MNWDFQTEPNPGVCQIVPKICGFITLSASVVSPSVVKIGR